MSRANYNDQFKFLISCIRWSNNGKINFGEVATECGIVTKGAAAKRYERMMKTHGIQTNARPYTIKDFDCENDKLAPTPPVKKRKAVDFPDNEGLQDDEECFEPRPKVDPDIEEDNILAKDIAATDLSEESFVSSSMPEINLETRYSPGGTYDQRNFDDYNAYRTEPPVNFRHSDFGHFHSPPSQLTNLAVHQDSSALSIQGGLIPYTANPCGEDIMSFVQRSQKRQVSSSGRLDHESRARWIDQTVDYLAVDD